MPTVILIRDTAVAIVVGMILLLSLSKLIGRVQFSLSTAFWCSFIGHIFISAIGLVTGLLFAYHLTIGIIVELAIGFVFLTALFQMAVRANGGTLVRWRAAILSLIVILGDFFIASFLIELWEHFRS